MGQGVRFIISSAQDRMLAVRVTPEQDREIRVPHLPGARMMYYHHPDGLFTLPAEDAKAAPPSPASLTSLMSAFARSWHTEHAAVPVFRDKVARQLFSDEEYGKLTGFIAAAGAEATDYVHRQLAPNVLMRSRFCEDTLETAVRTGTVQYVLLGCGLDTFALRNERLHLRVFEVDRPDAIADRQRRMERAGLLPPSAVQTPCVLTKDDWAACLTQGFDPHRKTLFAALGLLYYLTEDEISRLFEHLAAIAAEGSSLIFDLPDDHLLSSRDARAQMMCCMAAQCGEPMHPGSSRLHLKKLLAKNSFVPAEYMTAKEIQKPYFDGTGIQAFPHVHLCRAVWKA